MWLRHQGPLLRVKSLKALKNTVTILLDHEERAVTAGQSAVIYSGSEVLGGGVVVQRQPPLLYFLPDHDSTRNPHRLFKVFKDREHTVIPRALLVPQNDPNTLFTGSGMQPLIPYLFGSRT